MSAVNRLSATSNALIGSELLTAAPSDYAALKKASNAIRK
jgi:hypothetical protein